MLIPVGLATAAWAGVDRGGYTVFGQITVLDPPPPDVSEDALESDLTMYFFEERTRTLPNDLAVDIVDPGIYDDPGDLVNAFLPAGTLVSSYFVHADNDKRDPGVPRLEGSITFGQPVLGIIVTSDKLTDSDPLLGNPGTIYTTGVPNDAQRGAELIECPIELSPDRHTVYVCTLSFLERDQIRIITEVPEPATWSLLLASCAAFLRRR